MTLDNTRTGNPDSSASTGSAPEGSEVVVRPRELAVVIEPSLAGHRRAERLPASSFVL